ncbi:MAG TPA: GDSL-type esterase/lipase family protein [Chthoniobacteraceae bacterium]|jgi:lysophospholipase L1-like esterase|nr:GDSL-type esterase/lipase family protein [Chthoniobacteraceae bacterium]
MKNKSLAFAAALLTSGSLLFAQQAAPPAAPAKATPAATPAAKPAQPPLPPQPPDVPAPKVGPDGAPQAGFIAQHEKYVALAKKGDIGVVFLGDSITAGWVGAKEIWDKSFGQYKPVNFGIGGDRTQHVLWRIQNGELDGISPKALVLMIGTNNSGGDKPEGIASGITKIVETVRQKCPNTKILLLAIFPRGPSPTFPNRVTNEAANKIISKLDDGKHVFYLDIGKKFLKEDGSFKDDISKDLLHFVPAGYQIEADAIGPKLAELMK